MNFATVLIILVLAALVGLAVRYLKKHGMCAACENRAACRAARKAGGVGSNDNGQFSSCCGGKCSSCRYYESEQAAAKNKA